ncbi:MAG: hypothetical protein K8R56_09040 [Candidatus Eisenbacteria bacterium]|nr:hypothetical protein [Candidatus Eisenbacteria bacterium]
MNAILDTRAPAEPIVLAARRWLSPVREQLGNAFLSAYITGGALNEGFDPEHRHVNVLVVTEELPISRLDALAAVVPASKKAPHIDPLFMTLQQVQRSLDVFPIEWLDLQERHYTLEGVDLFTALEVPQTYLRLQIEQELRGKHLRLTQGYVLGAAHPEHLHATLARLASGFHTLFRALIRLHDEAPPSSLERVTARVAELYDLDAEALGAAHRMRSQRRHPGADETRAVYRSFLAQIERLTSAVDGFRIS